MKKQMGGDAAEDDLGSEEEMEEEGEGEGEGGGEGGGEGKREKVEREETPGPSSSSSSTVKKQSPPNKDGKFESMIQACPYYYAICSTLLIDLFLCDLLVSD